MTTMSELVLIDLGGNTWVNPKLIAAVEIAYSTDKTRVTLTSGSVHIVPRRLSEVLTAIQGVKP